MNGIFPWHFGEVYDCLPVSVLRCFVQTEAQRVLETKLHLNQKMQFTWTWLNPEDEHDVLNASFDYNLPGYVPCYTKNLSHQSPELLI